MRIGSLSIFTIAISVEDTYARIKKYTEYCEYLNRADIHTGRFDPLTEYIKR